MFQPSAKRCFTIESLVGKDTPLGPEDPPRPAALAYPGPAAAADAAAFAPGFQGAAGRALYGSAELVFPEAVGHPALPVGPPQLGGSALPHPHPFFGPQHRDPLNFYPWVLRNRFFGHRFQGEPPAARPFARKPKRIRTAFSPSQLLRLERAFEKNHYVVGAERKQLASSLSLSETQGSQELNCGIGRDPRNCGIGRIPGTELWDRQGSQELNCGIGRDPRNCGISRDPRNCGIGRDPRNCGIGRDPRNCGCCGIGRDPRNCGIGRDPRN
ncbi:hypothetical protein DUI87_34891 [Hirundo rustica rustica]|uniref:Homeobox domain-containing protein n=1 Tax=Hirundo rustica rustica TaxID=333673 RepID=A0A3M0J297_HIRRU|nr:hypothetical protein DUI87_34891 [Hirundo rustica rustica]